MRVRILLVAFVLIASPAFPQVLRVSRDSGTEKIYLPWGRIEITNNEVSIVSTVDDPPKLRIASAVGLGLGAISWGRLRPDGVQEEMVLFQGKQNECTRDDSKAVAGEITIHVSDGHGGDDGMVKALEARSDGVWLLGHTFTRHGQSFDPDSDGLTCDGLPAPSAPKPMPGPLPTLPLTGPHGLPIGDFDAVRVFYRFGSEDREAYALGQLTWDHLIARMDQRAR